MKPRSLRELVNRGDIKPFKAEKSEVTALLELALRDLAKAQGDLRGKDYDWSLAVSYNAILQASRAWMLFKGYRPALDAGHVVVIQFAMTTLEDSFGSEVSYIDVLRSKRHIAVYEKSGAVTEYESTHALKTAKKFVECVKNKIG